MKQRYCVGVTRAAAASIMPCLALLCVPTMSVAAAPSDSRPEADRASVPLARGAGHGQPQGEPRVWALQRRLRALGHRPGPVDGLYGPLTEAAVERLERDSGLSVDGIVGPQTRRVLNAETPPLAPGAGYGQPGGSPRVHDVQRRLRALGQRPGPVDGQYGPRTHAAIERFQRTAGQPASGVLSRATAAALARTDPDQPAHQASDRLNGNEPSQQAQRPASRAAASGADDRPGRADGSRPAGGSDESRTRTPAAGDRAGGTDGAHSTAPVLLVVLVLALAALGGMLAAWLMATRRRPGPSGVAGGPVKPTPIPTGGRHAAEPTAGSPVPSSRGPGGQRNGTAALGYASVVEAEALDGQHLRDQITAIDTACSQRGLVLDEVISDLELDNGTEPERPGLQSALQRLEAGEASCLVVADLARLSRSSPGDIVQWLLRRDTRLVAVNDGLDTGTTSGGEAAYQLLSPYALGGRERSGRTDPPAPVPELRPTETANGSSSPATPAMKQRMAANRMSVGGARAGATPAKTSAPSLEGPEMKREDDDRNGRCGRTPCRARSRAVRRLLRRRVPQHHPQMSVGKAENMRGGGMGPPGRYWEGTPISPAVNRLIDIVVAAVVLLLSAPLVVLLALAIVLESPGGVFYRAERVGFRGKPLRMLKFRKMHREAVGGPLTAHGDGRLTRVGAVLTRTRLDELPQFWHVLRGEMSLIGPRPEDPLFVRRRPDDFADILKVRPGISGFSQLAFADEPRILSRDDPVGDYVHRILPQKCALDRLYVCRATLGMDARIAFWTVVAMLLRRPVAVHRGTGAMSVRRRRSGTLQVWTDLSERRDLVADHGPSRAAMIAATTRSCCERLIPAKSRSVTVRSA